MEIVWFTVVSVGIYLVANGILTRIEDRVGKPLKYRSVVFFAIILTLALCTFELIDYMTTLQAK